MPSQKEWIELWSNSEWTWSTVNGVNGYEVRSTITGNTIFFPAAGYGPYSTSHGAEGAAACYWSTTVVSFEPYNAYSIYFDTNRKPMPSVDYDARCNRYSIRPVYGKPSPAIPVESVSLDNTEMELSIGGRKTLSATIIPENATDKGLSWYSLDNSVATVTSSGEVTGVSVGSTTIVASSHDRYGDGPKAARCQVTVKEAF